MNVLRLLLVAWLIIQFALPLLPMWGAFLSHDHITSEDVTARDWQAHGESHRNPRSGPTRAGEPIILSVAPTDGIASVFADTTTFTLGDQGFYPLPENFYPYISATDFFAFKLALPPLDPPPTPKPAKL